MAAYFRSPSGKPAAAGREFEIVSFFENRLQGARPRGAGRGARVVFGQGRPRRGHPVIRHAAGHLLAFGNGPPFSTRRPLHLQKAAAGTILLGFDMNLFLCDQGRPQTLLLMVFTFAAASDRLLSGKALGSRFHTPARSSGVGSAICAARPSPPPRPSSRQRRSGDSSISTIFLFNVAAAFCSLSRTCLGQWATHPSPLGRNGHQRQSRSFAAGLFLQRGGGKLSLVVKLTRTLIDFPSQLYCCVQVQTAAGGYSFARFP